MIRCIIEPNLTSKCAHCCLHCDERKTCKYTCYGLTEWREDEKQILRHCEYSLDEEIEEI